MIAAGIPLTIRAVNGLMEAAKRTGKPELAHWYFYEVMPAVGLEPDIVSWNTLLGAFGRNGHIDGAYDTWQVGSLSTLAPLLCHLTMTRWRCLRHQSDSTCMVQKCRCILDRCRATSETCNAQEKRNTTPSTNSSVSISDGRVHEFCNQ
jgi:hypothetical protein